MSLPPGFLDELMGRVSLAQVIGRKVAWDARRSNPSKGDLWAPCPFHQEKSASFHVDDAKGVYYCFGCQAKGNAITFLRESENLGFLDAVERLARDAGMVLPARDPASAARSAAVAGLAEVMEMAVRFYGAQLNGAGAAAARAYLDRRGVALATRETFGIGFAGGGRTALFDHLRGKGVAPGLIAEAGLCATPEGGGVPYDRFRDRILFPIRDGRGRAIAFGGRAMAVDARAKYLNSPETPLFDKGRTLYNIGPARAAAGKSRTLVVVEGYMDVIALVQAGLPHVVAPLGTAITADQLALIWRIADEPVIALDGDPAGRGAALRLIDLALPLLAAGKGLRFALMPAGQDPDDVIRTDGPDAFTSLLAASRPMLDLLWERETDGAALDSPERRAALDRRLRAHLDRIADPAIRAHYQTEIRDRRAALFAPARPARRAWKPFDPKAKPAPPPSLPQTRASLLAGRADAVETAARIRESAILLGCLNHPAVARAVEDRLEWATFLCADLAGIRDALLASLGQDEAGLPGRVATRLGRDPRVDLAATGPLSANRRFAPEAMLDEALQAVAETLERHAAAVGRTIETRDAERDMMGDADEGVTWRLRQAADATHAADSRALSESKNESNDESSLSRYLQELLDRPTSPNTRKR